MNATQIVNDLGLDISYGECLELIKEKRQKCLNNYEAIKGNPENTIWDVRECLRNIQAYNFVIEQAERYLNHEAK